MSEASIRIRVPFVDVDSSRRIHFTAMFRYMELAEHELMRSFGISYSSMSWDTAYPRAHLECDFHGAIRYDDEIMVEARVEHVGNRSWTLAFTAYPAPASENIDRHAQMLAKGRMTIVAMDPETEKAKPIPEELRRALLGE